MKIKVILLLPIIMACSFSNDKVEKVMKNTFWSIDFTEYVYAREYNYRIYREFEITEMNDIIQTDSIPIESSTYSYGMNVNYNGQDVIIIYGELIKPKLNLITYDNSIRPIAVLEDVGILFTYEQDENDKMFISKYHFTDEKMEFISSKPLQLKHRTFGIEGYFTPRIINDQLYTLISNDYMVQVVSIFLGSSKEIEFMVLDTFTDEFTSFLNVFIYDQNTFLYYRSDNKLFSSNNKEELIPYQKIFESHDKLYLVKNDSLFQFELPNNKYLTTLTDDEFEKIHAVVGQKLIFKEKPKVTSTKKLSEYDEIEYYGAPTFSIKKL